MNATVERAAHEIHRDAEFFCKFGGDKDAAIERGLRRLDEREVNVEAVRKRIHAMSMKNAPLIDCPCTVAECAEQIRRDAMSLRRIFRVADDVAIAEAIRMMNGVYDVDMAAVETVVRSIPLEAEEEQTPDEPWWYALGE
ncbi:hypothetical protein [Selenomonas sp. oral taxon 149]|uniref:hypothetical protein n=1 Tax=Selenomonas sp. oral taxon 149 TaxID=712535 RepID=UPI0001E0DA90|nr:hypothetical protein [Selenomonas sp. oral taxon 149]EFM22595.1 hypothetical protein HMPREF9166_1837 [Selenomonas sp. oral taxon 149 str. 67H29BP]